MTEPRKLDRIEFTNNDHICASLGMRTDALTGFMRATDMAGRDILVNLANVTHITEGH